MNGRTDRQNALVLAKAFGFLVFVGLMLVGLVAYSRHQAEELDRLRNPERPTVTEPRYTPEPQQYQGQHQECVWGKNSFSGQFQNVCVWVVDGQHLYVDSDGNVSQR